MTPAKTVTKQTRRTPARASRHDDDEDDAPAKREYPTLWTPPGQFSYPNLAHPDERPQYGDGSFKTDLLIRKAEFKKKGDELKDAVLTVGRDAFGTKFDLKGGKFRSPFKDTDTDDRIEDERQKGAVLIRASAKPNKNGVARQPKVLTPTFDDTGKLGFLTQEEIEAIKGGDWGKLYVYVYPYSQSGGGVTFGLNAVHFWKRGEAFGQGMTKLLESTEEFEIDEEELSEVETAPKRGKGKTRVARDEPEEDEEEQLSEVETRRGKSSPAKRTAAREEQEEEEVETRRGKGKKTAARDEQEDEDAWEEEDEAPARLNGRGKRSSSRNDEHDDLF